MSRRKFFAYLVALPFVTKLIFARKPEFHLYDPERYYHGWNILINDHEMRVVSDQILIPKLRNLTGPPIYREDNILRPEMPVVVYENYRR